MLSGIFKTKKGYYERVNGKLNKINLIYSLFEKNNSGNYSYVLNKDEKYIRKDFNSKKDFDNYYNRYKDLKILKKINPVINYTYKNYWNKQNFEEPRIVYLDIETIDLKNREFPLPYYADAPITHIQLRDSKTKKDIIFCLKDVSENLRKKYPEVKFIIRENEKDLLEVYGTVIKKLNPDVVTAYNGNFFDFPYIFFRSVKLGLDPSTFSPLSEYKFNIKFKKGDEYINFYDILEANEFIKNTPKNQFKMVTSDIQYIGYYQMDYLEIFKKFNFDSLPNYRLEYLTYKYLKEGEGKISYKQFSSIFEFYEKDYDGFTEYAIFDVRTLDKLEEKFGFFNIIVDMALTFGVNWDLTLGTVQLWATYLTLVFLDKKYVVPEDITKERGENMLGGYVGDPVIGKHNWIMSIDYNSLYPSIMQATNVCATTYIPREKLPEELKEIYDYFRDQDEIKLLKNKNLQEKIRKLTHKYNVSFAGTAFYRRDERGIIADIVENLYYGRKQDKQHMLLAEVIAHNTEENKGKILNSEEVISEIENGEITWDNVYEYQVDNIEIINRFILVKKIKQMSKKLAMNSLYGAISNNHFLFFNWDIAAGITFTGRFLIQKTAIDVPNKIQEFYKKEKII